MAALTRPSVEAGHKNTELFNKKIKKYEYIRVYTHLHFSVAHIWAHMLHYIWEVDFFWLCKCTYEKSHIFYNAYKFRMNLVFVSVVFCVVSAEARSHIWSAVMFALLRCQFCLIKQQAVQQQQIYNIPNNTYMQTNHIQC